MEKDDQYVPQYICLFDNISQNQIMIKSSQPEEIDVTDSSTPPNLEPLHASAQPELPSNSQIIRSIISSNEELINQQKIVIKQLQNQNIEQENTIKELKEKYESLLQFTKTQIQSNSKAEKYESAGHTPKDDKINVKQILDKIHQLQQQLTKTKVELAIKSQELLAFSLKKPNQNEFNQTLKHVENVNVSRNSLEQYFQPLPYQKFSSSNGNILHQSKQVLSLWYKQLQWLNSQGSNEKFKQRTQSLIKRFIPKQLRNKLWHSLVENKLGMTSSLYFHLLERRNKNWTCEKVQKQIDKDIKRSFYGKTQYETKTGLILQISQFLEIFHIYRPDVSYVQGMTYPAIILIPVLGKIKAFHVFCNLLLGNSFFRKIFSLAQGFVETVCRTFELLLHDFSPNVAKKLEKVSVQSQIFLIQWLFTLFSRGLSFETTLKIWDNLIFFEQLSVFRISLSILEQLEPLILDLGYEGIIEVIRNYGDNIDEEHFLESLSNHKLTKDKVNRALDKIQKNK